MSYPLSQKGYLFHGATIHTAGEQGVIKSGALYIEDHKIVWIGPAKDWSQSHLSPERELDIINCTGEHICPGFIDTHCHLDLGGKPLRSQHQDSNQFAPVMSPQLRAIDSVSAQNIIFEQARLAGVTTVCILPSSPNLINGTGVVLKTFGQDVETMCLRNPACLSINFGYKFKETHPQKEQEPFELMVLADTLRSAFEGALTYETNRLLNPEQTSVDQGKEILVSALRRDLPIHAQALHRDEISLALRLASEFGFQMIIKYGYEWTQAVEDFKRLGACLVYGPILRANTLSHEPNLDFTHANRLTKAGVRFAQMSDYPFVPMQLFSTQAGLHIRGGLDEQEALKSITAYPAVLLGLAHRIGQLKIGLDADLLRLSGPPLEIKTHVIETWLNGSVVVKGVSQSHFAKPI